MKIAKNNVVSIHYTLKDPQGNILDSSEGREPLTYIQGIGQLIPGLENELEGKSKGDKLNAVIEPKDAYGEKSDQMIHTVPLSGFQSSNGEELAVGMQVQVETNNGPAMAVVSDIQGQDVTLDMNHPLAGVTLHFDVEVTDVRAADPSELEHGHVHGPGGHQH
ncbi:MAG: peptidylprolyl isomerase [Vicingaceae bacterium]